jgi:hypothetical protein
LQSAQASLPERAWWSAVLRASPGERRGPAQALLWELAVWAPAVLQEEPLQAAVLAESARGVPREASQPEAVSVRAAAGPRPEAASVPWVQQVAGEAAAVPGASEPAEAEVSDATGRLPAAAEPEDAEVQPRAAALSGARELRAVPRPEEAALPDAQRVAVPLALLSAAASVFRQGQSLAGPARRRAARFAHAIRCLPIASRSEPWSQAARNEGWSCGELPRKVL